MSGLTLTPRDRRLLAIGSSLVLAIIVFGRGLPVVRVWQSETHAAATELALERERARAAVAGFAAARDSASARRVRLMIVERDLLHGDTPAVAAATLASFVAEAATEAGVRLGSVQVSTDTSARRRYSRLRVTADGTGGASEVANLLGSLESSAVRLAVRELGITQNEPAAPPARPEQLRVSLVIEALSVQPARDSWVPSRRRGAPNADSATTLAQRQRGQ